MYLKPYLFVQIDCNIPCGLFAKVLKIKVLGLILVVIQRFKIFVLA